MQKKLSFSKKKERAREQIDIQFVLREINYSFGNSILHEIYEILSACLPSVHMKSAAFEFLLNCHHQWLT